METIKLHVSKKIYNELLNYLNQFKEEDLVILKEKEYHRNYLERQLQEMDNDPEFMTLEQLDALLEMTIEKHEN